MLADAYEMHEIMGMETIQLEAVDSEIINQLDTQQIIANPVNEAATFPKLGFTPFTKETAADYGRKGGINTAKRMAERKQRLLALLAAEPPQRVEAQLEARKSRAAKDIDRIDKMIDSCNEAELLVKLIESKSKLWKLLFPQPKAQRSRRDFTRAEPLE